MGLAGLCGGKTQRVRFGFGDVDPGFRGVEPEDCCVGGAFGGLTVGVHEGDTTVQGHWRVELVFEDVEVKQTVRFSVLALSGRGRFQGEWGCVFGNSIDMFVVDECDIQSNRFRTYSQYDLVCRVPRGLESCFPLKDSSHIPSSSSSSASLVICSSPPSPSFCSSTFLTLFPLQCSTLSKFLSFRTISTVSSLKNSILNGK